MQITSIHITRFLCVVMTVAMCVSVYGCASTGNNAKGIYISEKAEYKEFKELTDQEAVDMVCRIYNVIARTRFEEMAKSIALSEYMKALGKRKSALVRDSGILNVEYEKVDIRKWTNDEIISFNSLLNARLAKYSTEPLAYLTDEENIERVVFLTARECVASDIKRRQGFEYGMGVAEMLLGAAASAALSFI